MIVDLIAIINSMPIEVRFMIVVVAITAIATIAMQPLQLASSLAADSIEVMIVMIKTTRIIEGFIARKVVIAMLIASINQAKQGYCFHWQ